MWVVRQDGRAVGPAEIKPYRTPGPDGHEIVYAVTPAAWGQGLGTEIAEVLVARGFDALGLAEVQRHRGHRRRGVARPAAPDRLPPCP